MAKKDKMSFGFDANEDENETVTEVEASVTPSQENTTPIVTDVVDEYKGHGGSYVVGEDGVKRKI